jgi:hypothetical protein
MNHQRRETKGNTAFEGHTKLSNYSARLVQKVVKV